MIIDCDSCEVRGLACGDCVVTALLGAPPGGMEIDDGERAAIDALAGSGSGAAAAAGSARSSRSTRRGPGEASDAVGRTGESAAAG